MQEYFRNVAVINTFSKCKYAHKCQICRQRAEEHLAYELTWKSFAGDAIQN